jgi:hypothetical protein
VGWDRGLPAEGNTSPGLEGWIGVSRGWGHSRLRSKPSQVTLPLYTAPSGRQVLVEWINAMLLPEHIVVRSLEEDMFDGLILDHLFRKPCPIPHLLAALGATRPLPWPHLASPVPTDGFLPQSPPHTWVKEHQSCFLDG